MEVRDIKTETSEEKGSQTPYLQEGEQKRYGNTGEDNQVEKVGTPESN